MKKNPAIGLLSRIKDVIVVVKAEPYYSSVDTYGFEDKVVVDQKTFKYPRKFKMTIPLIINYDGYVSDNVNTINAIIAKNINGLAAKLTEEAESLGVYDFSGITFYIIDISSEKEEDDSVVAEWILV